MIFLTQSTLCDRDYRVRHLRPEERGPEANERTQRDQSVREKSGVIGSVNRKPQS